MSTRDDERAAFEAALDAEPADQTVRAVYADWLEENQPERDASILAAGMRWMGGERGSAVQSVQST